MSKIFVASVSFFSLLVLCASCSNHHLGPGMNADWLLLLNGKYEFTTAIRFSGQQKKTNEKRIVNLENKNGNITIVEPAQTEYPIIGTLDGNNFTAMLNDAGGRVSVKGQLVGDNELLGELEGTSEDGEASVEGTFSIIMKGAESRNQ